MRQHSAFTAIFRAGLTCAVLDGLSATLVSWLFGATPVRLFQGIAVGLLGRSAFQAGVPSALLGVALHFLVAFGAATVYYFASRSLPVLLDRALLSGILYGAVVHVFMTFVVIPLSAIGSRPFVLKTFAAFLLVSMVVVGPSISLTVRRFSRHT